MRLRKIFDREKRLRKFSMVKKRATSAFKPAVESIPVFIFGKQRSGTTMTMLVFHARRDTEAYDERLKSRAFLNFRIRPFDDVERLVNQSKAPFVCFKTLADSHRTPEFAARFPAARLVWIYRNYVSVALSSLKKFGHATRAIRLVCTGQSGGGWFQDGVSEATERVLREIYSPDLTELDLACLVWWARNRLVLELELMHWPNLLIARYEDLVLDRQKAFEELFGFIGMPHDGRAVDRVVRETLPPAPPVELHPRVRDLCEDLLDTLDEHVRHRRQGGRG